MRLKLLHLSWSSCQKLIESIATQIKKSGFKSDLIVAVSRGGFIPARILCDQLSLKRLISLQIEYYQDIGERRVSPKMIYPLNADVKDLRILLVDDISDSGSSLRFARDHILSLEASKAKTATMHVKPWTSFNPDYYAKKTDAWIVYPWEPLETANAIARKLRLEGLNGEELKKRLINLGFSKRVVNKVDLDFYSSI